jgi:DNA-binding SARP family transcriptional activator
VPLLLLAAGADERAGQQWRLTDEVLSGTAHADPVTVAARPPAADQVAVLIDHVRTADAVAPTDTSYVQLREDAPPAPVTEPTEPAMSIAVLGPVELTGIAMPRRTPAFQTLVYLALHRRGVTAEQLSTALWPDELAAGKTIRNRVAEARAVVEGAISDGPGWRLDEAIGSDWQRFQTLAAGTAEQQLAALDLVRGQPFDGFTDEWVDLEMFRTDMVAAVIDLAVTVAERALDDGEPAVAFRAARAGLRASPYEERLFRLAMRAADAEGSTGKLRALKNELQRVLDVQIEPDDRMQRETIALYEELTSAAHRRTRVGSVSVTPSG